MAVPDTTPASAAVERSTLSTTEPRLADIVARVDTGELSLRMVEIFQSEIDSYRGLAADVLRGEIVEISRHNLELFFVSLVHGSPVRDEDLQPFRESARRRAREGLPLEDLLHAYRRGGQLGWEALVAAARDDERATLLPAVTRLLEYVDRVSHVVADTYHEQQRSLVSAEERRLRDLFGALVAGEPLDRPAREAADRLRFPLVARYRPFAAAVVEPSAQPELTATLRSRGALAISDGERAVGLLAPDTSPAALADPSIVIALGEATDRRALAGALDDTRLLLDVGCRLGARGTITAKQYLAELLLVRSPQLGEVVRRAALGSLEDYAARRSRDLLETLTVFLECDCERRRAAQLLHVHPNTLDYRLRRIEELSGLNLSRADDLMLVNLALKQRRLAGGER
jgi:hypothetical protein